MEEAAAQPHQAPHGGQPPTREREGGARKIWSQFCVHSRGKILTQTISMLQMGFVGREATNLILAPKCGCVLATYVSSMLLAAAATLAPVPKSLTGALSEAMTNGKSSGDFLHARKMACHVHEKEKEAGSNQLPMPSLSRRPPTTHTLFSGLWGHKLWSEKGQWYTQGCMSADAPIQACTNWPRLARHRCPCLQSRTLIPCGIWSAKPPKDVCGPKLMAQSSTPAQTQCTMNDRCCRDVARQSR